MLMFWRELELKRTSSRPRWVTSGNRFGSR